MFRFTPILVLCVACVDLDSSSPDGLVDTIDTSVPTTDTGWRPHIEIEQPRWLDVPKPSPVPRRPAPAALISLDGHARGDLRVLEVPAARSEVWELGLCMGASPVQEIVLDCSGLAIVVEAGFPAGGTVWTRGTGDLPERFECTGGAWLADEPDCRHWLELH